MTTTQVDDRVTIPAAVRAAGAAAEAYYKQETPAEGSDDGDTKAQPQEAAAETKTETPENRQEAPESGVTFDSSSETKSEEDQSWEHRYKSMKGRFDRSQEQIRTLSEQIQSLQSVISTMQATTYSSKPSSDEAEAAIERLITPEEESDYGSEFLSVVGKKAREELLPIINKYEAKIAQLEGQLQGVGGKIAQDARQQMFGQLDDKIPNWREINRDENFLQWLQLPDLYSGAIRHELLKAAFERNDAPRVAAFFTGFLAEEAAVAPAMGETGRTQAPAKPSLEDFAAPGRAKSAAATNAPAEKPIFTRAQITKFYADAAAGKYRGKDAERDRLERQIFDAEREGRIRS